MPDDLTRSPADAVEDRFALRTVRVPAVAPDAVYALWQHDATLLWHPPAGWQAVAAGVAARLDASGPRGVATLRETGERLWRGLRSPDDADAPAPRLWGGCAFAPGAASRAPWEDFGDASFVLPRLTYWTDGASAWLQGVQTGRDDALAADMAAARHAIEQLAHTAARPDDAAARVPPAACRITPPAEAEWRRQVNGILAAIDAGEVRKVVAARCATVAFERPPSVAAVLRNLRDETGPVWRFAITRGSATLLGATPELLVSRQGRDVRAEALAGTLSTAAGSGDDLLASAKDRREHQFVCDAIVAALAPLCSELRLPPAPTIRTLRRLFHLATPVSGCLARPTHVLELCERLHPTPATCGTPRERALDMILSAELAPRGWYAAPVGWFDAAGDGEFAVALRSGLVRGDMAYVYAGAGIVAGSRADRELAETELKQRVLLRALGVAAT